MKSHQLTTWLLSGLCAVVAASCTGKEEVQPERIRVRYTQTMCDDPWGAAQGEQELVAAAQSFLVQNNLTLYQPRATTGPAASGFGCNTPTGLVLEGSAAPKDVPTLLNLGFTKQP